MAARHDLRRHIAKQHGGCNNAFAKVAGVSRPLVSMWVRGRRKPSPERAIQIERLTGIPTSAWRSPRIDRAIALLSLAP